MPSPASAILCTNESCSYVATAGTSSRLPGRGTNCRLHGSTTPNQLSLAASPTGFRTRRNVAAIRACDLKTPSPPRFPEDDHDGYCWRGILAILRVGSSSAIPRPSTSSRFFGQFRKHTRITYAIGSGISMNSYETCKHTVVSNCGADRFHLVCETLSERFQDCEFEVMRVCNARDLIPLAAPYSPGCPKH